MIGHISLNKKRIHKFKLIKLNGEEKLSKDVNELSMDAKTSW